MNQFTKKRYKNKIERLGFNYDNLTDDKCEIIIHQIQIFESLLNHLIDKRKEAIKTLNMNYRYDKEIATYLTANEQFLTDIRELFSDWLEDR